MAEMTVEIPDELARRCQSVGPWLPTVIEISLVGFKTLATTTASEVIEFLRKNPSSQEVADFQVSQSAQSRLQRLLALNQAGMLSPSEQAELDELEQLEHIIIMLKTQAAKRLKESR